jgi:nucleoid-associated protein YgaU
MTGCASNGGNQQTSATNNTTTCTVPTDQQSQNSTNTNQQPSTPDHQHSNQSLQDLSTQGRIAQLKRDQLEAQAHKALHSKHFTAKTETTQKIPAAPQDDNDASAATVEYTVDGGETLYSIAAQTNIYNDGLLWPMIYKANRDQIKNPEQIFPGQKLTIQQKASETEKEDAREIARESGIFIH